MTEALGRSRLGLTLLLAVACTAIDAVALLLLGRLLHHVSSLPGSEPGGSALYVPLALFAAASVARLCLQYQRDMAFIRLRLDFLAMLRDRLYRRLMAASWVQLAPQRHAHVLSVLTSDLDRINAGTLALIQLLVSAGVGLVTLAVAIHLAPALILPAVVAGAVLALPLLGQARRAGALGQRLTDAHRIFVASATDFLATLKLVKVQGGEDVLLGHVQRAGASLDAEQAAFMREQGLRTAATQAGGLLLLCGLLLIGVLALQLPLATLLLALYLLARMVPLVNQSATLSQMLAHMLPAWRALRQFEEKLVNPPGPRTPDSHAPPLTLARGIDLTDVIVRYPEAAHAALDGVRLCIPARKTVALVGASGAGKTTLIDTVLGLIRPDQGCVTVDGLALDAGALPHWQRMVAYVPQDTVLLPVSVRQNLLWHDDGLDDATLWRALAAAEADGFVRHLPQGLDTVLGEHGAGLSGGERQRLMLARALLRKPELLVLDEATSHLDTETEQAVRQSLKRLSGSMTVLLVAHRLSTVRDADLLVLMDRGRVLATGTWDELVATQPLFASLVAADRRETP